MHAHLEAHCASSPHMAPPVYRQGTLSCRCAPSATQSCAQAIDHRTVPRLRRCRVGVCRLRSSYELAPRHTCSIERAGQARTGAGTVHRARPEPLLCARASLFYAPCSTPCHALPRRLWHLRFYKNSYNTWMYEHNIIFSSSFRVGTQSVLPCLPRPQRHFFTSGNLT